MTRATRPVVAFVSDAQEFAGAEQYMITLIDGLRDRYDFLVIHGSDAPLETREKVEAAGARSVVIPGLRRRPSPRAAVRLTRFVRTLRPAIVHVNASDQGGGVAAFAATHFVRTPVIATLHNVIPGRGLAKEALSNLMLTRADTVIAVSDRLDRYLDHVGVAHTVVKNGLWPPALHPDARPRLGLAADEFVVGGIGRLDRQKGWDVLCAAASIVHDAIGDVKFIVIGDGPEGRRLRALQACRHVQFAGRIPDAARLIGAFDLLVMPSRYEGLGLVAIEGMLGGVPILASDIEGLAEVIADCGRIVPAEDPARLAAAIVALHEDADERRNLAARAAERAADLFTAEEMLRQTTAVYEAILVDKDPLR